MDYRLRFVPIGGVIGVTKNMYLYELYEGDKLKDILIVDCGIGFPREKELGVDFTIPDVSYLEDKIDKIRGILVSHGHYDHFAALPYNYKTLGNPKIYTNKLTISFIKNVFKEFGVSPDVVQVDLNKEYVFGEFKVEFINVTHSIPDTMHMVIKTPVGNIYHGTDYKFDLTPPYGPTPDFYKITKAGKEGVLCLLSDCLGSETDGLTLSENIVGETFEREMKRTKGKFIMTTFSTNISRIRQCIEVAMKLGRKVVFLGRSMRENTRLATEINYLPIPHGVLIKEEEVKRMPPNKVCLIVAGSQGQYNSALVKLANRQNKNISIKNGDKVMFSSDPIPGNEDEVYELIEELTVQGADVAYPDIKDQLHASGHGNKEDLKLLVRFTRPKYLIPIGGTARHQKQYQKLTEELGIEENRVFLLDEGQTVWFTKNEAKRGEKIETKNIYVDARGVGDVGTIVLRDRKTLASEGVMVVVLAVDNEGKLIAAPKILSRGFVFEKAEEELFSRASGLIESIIKPRPGKIIYFGSIKKDVASALEDFLFKERGRRPLVLVDIIQV